MAQGNRANENDGPGPGYELGELEIVRTGRASGERPVVQAPEKAAAPIAPTPARPANAAARGAPRNLTLADGELGPALELDLGGALDLPRGSVPANHVNRATPSVPSRVSTPAAHGAPAAQRPAPPPAAGARAPATPSVPSFGDNDKLDDDFDGGFASLPSLDVEQVERRSAERVGTKEPAPVLTQAKERDEREIIAALADFGIAPRGWLPSVRYAAHVATRVWKLRKARTLALATLRERLTEHHAALVAMGQGLMRLSTDPRVEPLRAKMAHVVDEQTKLAHADQGVSRTREGNERAMALLRSEAEHLKEQLAPYVEAEQQALGVQRKIEEELRRAQAMQKRTEIELRALDAAAQAEPARADALNAQLTQRRDVVAAVGAKLAQANEALGKARRDLAMSRGALDANEEKQKQLENESRARVAAAEGQKQAANGAYEVALSELAEAAKKQPQLSALVADLAAATQVTERAVELAGVELTRFDAALKLYDRSAVIRGAVLFSAVFVALIAVLVMR